jgi:hypothetical protein
MKLIPNYIYIHFRYEHSNALTRLVQNMETGLYKLKCGPGLKVLDIPESHKGQSNFFKDTSRFKYLNLQLERSKKEARLSEMIGSMTRGNLETIEHQKGPARRSYSATTRRSHSATTKKVDSSTNYAVNSVRGIQNIAHFTNLHSKEDHYRYSSNHDSAHTSARGHHQKSPFYYDEDRPSNSVRIFNYFLINSLLT